MLRIFLVAIALCAAVGCSPPVQGAQLILPSFTVANSGSACPDDDGSSGSTGGASNYPGLLTGTNYLGVTYAATINGAHGLGCRVAGVDYYVGIPQGMALSDPTTAPLPTGCAYDGKQYVRCSGSGTVQGYDFSLHSPTLLTTSGTWTITNNKFAFGSNCIDPVVSASGSLVLTHNTLDGTAGFGCNLSQGTGTLVNVNVAAGGSFVARWNYSLKIPQDMFDMNLPSSGAETVLVSDNLGYLEGSTGHPDYVQFCGGGAGTVTPTIEHNTFYNYPFTGIGQGIQPLHVEAQTCSGLGHIANSETRFNTVITQGTCQGGRNYPTGCSANYDIACKQDDTSSNVGYEADGNYVDWSGAIAALTNGYHCPSTVWGSPYANYDMTAGSALASP